jgi:hypothetical protein
MLIWREKAGNSVIKAIDPVLAHAERRRMDLR